MLLRVIFVCANGIALVGDRVEFFGYEVELHTSIDV